MKKLHRLIISSYLGPLVLTFFIAIFILVMQFLWKYVDDLMGKGLDVGIILELLFYASASLVTMALPLAILLSSIMLFGSLAEHYELVAMKSAGMSLLKIMMPLIVFMVMLSIGAYYFSNNLWPVANLKFRTLLWDVTQQRPALNIKPGVFYKGIDGYSIRVKKKNKIDDSLEEILIYRNAGNEAGNRNVLFAKRGKMGRSEDGRLLIFTLQEGIKYSNPAPEPGKENRMRQTISRFQEEIVRLDLSEFQLSRTSESAFAENYQMYNMDQLIQAIDSLNKMVIGKSSEIEDLGYRNHYLGRAIRGYATREEPPVEPPNPLGLRSSRPIPEITYENNLPRIEQCLFSVTPSIGVLNDFRINDRRRVITGAIVHAREAQSNIEGNLSHLNSRVNSLAAHQLEWHRKLTLSFACLVLFFIGAPLGAIIRRGGLGLPVVWAFAFFILYHIISITGEKMAGALTIEPWVGMWMSSAVLFPIGVFLTYKAAKDSRLFEGEAYSRVFESIFKRWKKQPQ